MAAPRRRFGLDALRGVAVFLMIEQHVGIWLWRGPDPGRWFGDYPVLVAFNALGGMAAPLFVTLAGTGSALFIASERPRTDVTLVRRGLVLMLFGYVLNLATPSWFSWGSWFVLHMMGFAMATTPLWRRLATPALLGLGLLAFVAMVIVQSALHTPFLLDNEAMRDVERRGVWRLALAEGQFPILPWLAFYLAGMVAGRWSLAGRRRRIAGLGLVCIALAGVGVLLHVMHALPLPAAVARRAFGLTLGFFPPKVSVCLPLLGGALLLVAGVLALDERGSFDARHPLVTLGRASLTLLMLHVPLFREWTRVPAIDWWRALSAGTTLVVVFGFLALAIVVTRAWQRVEYRFGAEWVLRKLGG